MFFFKILFSVTSYLAICELPAIPRSNYARGGVMEDGEVVLIECNMGFSYNRQARFLVSCNQGELDPTTVVPQACYCKYAMYPPCYYQWQLMVSRDHALYKEAKLLSVFHLKRTKAQPSSLAGRCHFFNLLRHNVIKILCCSFPLLLLFTVDI